MRKSIKKYVAGVLAMSTVLTQMLAFGTNAKADVNDEMFVLMNIPYEAFYDAEITKNSIDVDVVSSATKVKTKNTGIVKGSYHKDSKGEEISGVTFYVKANVEELQELKTIYSDAKVVTDSDVVTIETTNRGTTTSTEYVGKDSLFEAPSYSYYVLSEEPSYYKELSIDNRVVSFGEILGYTKTEFDSSDIVYTVKTKTSYGDYEIDMTGLSPYVSTADNIYGTIIETTDGTQYGLRHLENIWRATSLAWSFGYVTKTHGCELKYDHYVSMQGKTISKITYFTDKGEFVVNNINEYVPKYYDKNTYGATAVDAKLSNGDMPVRVSLNAPKDSEYEVSKVTVGNKVLIKNVDYTTTTFANNEATIILKKTENVVPGEYKVVLGDLTNPSYIDMETSFALNYELDENAVQLKENRILLNTDKFSLEQFIGAVTTVKVNGSAVSGATGSTLINPDGSIKLDAATMRTVLFAEEGEYQVELVAPGYMTVCGTVLVSDHETSSDDDNNDQNDNGNSGQNSNGNNDLNDGDNNEQNENGNNSHNNDQNENGSIDGKNENGSNNDKDENKEYGSVSDGKDNASNNEKGEIIVDEEVPRTGDTTNVSLFAGIMIVACFTLGAVQLRKRKEIE